MVLALCTVHARSIGEKGLIHEIATDFQVVRWWNSVLNSIYGFGSQQCFIETGEIESFLCVLESYEGLIYRFKD